MLLLWLVYALRFIHVVPYLWFYFANENPRKLWGVAVNPYMFEEKVVQLTAMIGAVGGVGFAFGVSLNKKIIVPDYGMNPIGNRRLVRNFPTPIWMISYVLLAFALCDAALDQKSQRRAFKKQIVFGR